MVKQLPEITHSPRRKPYVHFRLIADLRLRGHLGVMNFVVRPACFADVPDMHRVRNSVRENRLSDAERVSERSYLPYIEAGAAWVVELKETIAAFAVLDSPAKSVWALFVDPDAEGQGIGRALHEAVVESETTAHKGTLT